MTEHDWIWLREELTHDMPVTRPILVCTVHGERVDATNQLLYLNQGDTYDLHPRVPSAEPSWERPLVPRGERP